MNKEDVIFAIQCAHETLHPDSEYRDAMVEYVFSIIEQPKEQPKEQEKTDPIVNAVIDKFAQRSKVGIKKYGTTLAENNTDDFLNHLHEELMDAVLYIEKLKNI